MAYISPLMMRMMTAAVMKKEIIMAAVPTLAEHLHAGCCAECFTWTFLFNFHKCLGHWALFHLLCTEEENKDQYD